MVWPSKCYQNFIVSLTSFRIKARPLKRPKNFKYISQEFTWRIETGIENLIMILDDNEKGWTWRLISFEHCNCFAIFIFEKPPISIVEKFGVKPVESSLIRSFHLTWPKWNHFHFGIYLFYLFRLEIVSLRSVIAIVEAFIRTIVARMTEGKSTARRLDGIKWIWNLNIPT